MLIARSRVSVWVQQLTQDSHQCALVRLEVSMNSSLRLFFSLQAKVPCPSSCWVLMEDCMTLVEHCVCSPL